MSTRPSPAIDLNADLGEGAGHDEELLELVTSANVACGAHAGDAATILATCAAAAERGVVIGAHPGYPDRAGFGRVAINLSAEALAASLSRQLAALADGAGLAGLAPRYVKSHGALYHRAATDPATAQLLADAAHAEGLYVILGPPGSISAAPQVGDAIQADADDAVPPIRRVVEGFADRAYAVDAEGRPTLVGREQPGAILGHDAAVAQALALATTGLATAADGQPVAVHPASICVHGDSPGAVALAREIRSELQRAGVRVEAFA